MQDLPPPLLLPVGLLAGPGKNVCCAQDGVCGVCVSTTETTYLDKNMHPSSVLRSSALWIGDIPFTDRVVVKYPWNAKTDTPEITGLTPDIVLLAEIESMKCT